MQSSVVSQQSFFSEENLFLLLNVIHETIGDAKVFDKSKSPDRQRLFEKMARVYRSHSDKSLNDINKVVLREIYVAVAQPQPLRTTPSSTGVLRDAEVNQRQMPVQFEDRPQQAFVRRDAVEDNSLDKAMHTLQNNRIADVVQAPPAIDFSTDMDTGMGTNPEDNSDVLTRLQDAEKSREAEAKAMNDVPTDQQPTLADAMQAFDKQNWHLDGNVSQATTHQQEQRSNHEAVFQQQQQYTSIGTNTHSTLEQGDSLPEFGNSLLQDAGATMAPDKLDTDVQLTQDVLQTKMDEREFQQALHLSKEEGALQERLSTTVTGVQEELLIQPRNDFTAVVNHLEVCSNDRVRTLPTSDVPCTPYAFTLYFNSNRPAYQVYPIYDNHPIEDPEEYTAGDTECKIKLDTMHVRHCEGLRGYPKSGMPSVGGGPLDFNTSVVSHYETVQLANVAGPNVDSVFYNVMSLQTNHVQIYYPHEHAPKYPYIVMEIEQFSNVYKSSNTLLRKSFCKLFYDRSSSPTLSNSQYHLYTPLNQEKKVFSTPLASIDRLTFKLYNSFGNPLDTINDVLHVKGFYLELDTPFTSYVNILLRDYVPEFHITEDNHIMFEKCIEWYNQAWYDAWMTDVGNQQVAQQEEVEDEYYDKLIAHRGADNDTLLRLKKDFARKQIKFEYPSVGHPVDARFADLQDYLQRPEGHKVLATGDYDLTTFTSPSTTGYVNSVRIAMPVVVDKSTGTSILREFGGNNASLDTDIRTDNYPLLSGTLLNNSVCTNISMTVVTREEESVVVSRNV